MFVINLCSLYGVSDLLLTGNQLRESLRQWVTPPDPSTNHNIACDIHYCGTAGWFFRGNIFAEWKSKGSLLWIYGKRMSFPHTSVDRPLITVLLLAGSGKSILWFVFTQHSHASLRA